MTKSLYDLATPGVQKLTPYAPGKPLDELEREYGIKDAVKLASNENPLGPSPKALSAIEESMSELHRYPDGNGFELKALLSSKTGLAENQITLGNGSNDILELIARTFVMPGQEVMFSAHAFAVYPIVTQAVNGVMNIVKANTEDHVMPYGHDLVAMQKAINENTRVVFIANPNNPTGTWLKETELYNFINSVPENIIIVVDEAYFEYVGEAEYPDTTKWLAEFKNLVVTRTFSKIYGIPAVRIGYGMSHPELADLLNRVRQPFNVNMVAQTAAIAVLDDHEYVTRSIETNNLGMEQLLDACDENGWGYIPSVGNFLCIDVGDKSDEVYEGLLREGVVVRPVANYQLPRYLRVTIGLKEENQRFIDALERVLDRLNS